MNERNEQIRVLLVDDHAMFRSGVKAELAAHPDLVVVGEASDPASAVCAIRAARPDVVLLDVHMPDGGGLAVLRTVLAKEGQPPAGPAPRFLALSVSDSAADVIALIRAGARGYVTKSISGDDLAESVRRVASGDAVFSPGLAGFVLDAFASAAVAEEPVSNPDLDSLTPRELDVLRLLARGYTYREIASELFISVKTVETHTSNVLRKTQQSNRNTLTWWAKDHKI